ncbi:MAG: DUF2905 domain-containing protein [Spirochaetes bacterium]|nr:DUF2905 domain-containing protein [Spirochaetota bacterium]
MGKILIMIGLFLIIVGVLMHFAGNIPFLGKLPGDITYRGRQFTLYVPIVSSIILSIILTIVFNLLFKFFK